MFSDRMGRKKVIGISVGVAVVWGLLVFPILDTGSTFAFAFVTFVTLIIFGVAYGPAGALLPELFHARYRYTGAGLAYNLAGIFGGGLPPLAAAAMVAAGNKLGVGIMLSLLSAISVMCVTVMKETSKNGMQAGVEDDLAVTEVA